MGKTGSRGQGGSGQHAHRVQGPEPEGLERHPEILSNLSSEGPIGLCYLDLDLRYVHINEWLAAINGLAVSEHRDGPACPPRRSTLRSVRRL